MIEKSRRIHVHMVYAPAFRLSCLYNGINVGKDSSHMENVGVPDRSKDSTVHGAHVI